jgi:hypothetical protein
MTRLSVTPRSFPRLRTGIRTSTPVDRNRCYELWQLVAQAAKLQGGALIEIGVWRGGTDSAKDIVNWTWPRLVPGGIIVYDDYGFHSCVGITRFVNEERDKPDRLVVHNLNGHAVVI